MIPTKIAELEKRIALLTRDSSNSSKPVSFDGLFAKAGACLHERPLKRKLGEQPGQKQGNRDFIHVLITAFLVWVSVMAAPAFAWEFSMSGEVEWRYKTWTRTGIHDIFGDMGGIVNLGINHLSTFPTTTTTTRIRNTYPIIGVVAGEDRMVST